MDRTTTRNGALTALTVLTAILACLALALALAPTASAVERHFERVSPHDKNNADIHGNGVLTAAAREGDAVAFHSLAAFGDTVGSGSVGFSSHVARRTPAGWVAKSTTPKVRPDAHQVFLHSTYVRLFSEDLKTAIVWGYDLPEVSGDTPLRNSIYALDIATRLLEPITVSQVEQPPHYDFSSYTAWPISADARHVTFETSTQFLPEAAPWVTNVYQWDEGTLSVAGVLPDGTVSASGSDLVPDNYRGAMSSDGTRLVFRVPSSAYGESQLFMRIDGTETVWISQPELSDEAQNVSNPAPVALEGVTPDGRVVFFTTSAALLDGDTNGSTDLYRFTASAEPGVDDDNLTLISREGEMAGGTVVGMSDDGQRVYYQTTADHLTVFDHGEHTLISSSITLASNFDDRLGVMDREPGLGRVTPDGRYVAFGLRSNGNSTDFLGNLTNGYRQMYLYDLEENVVRCVSCPVGGATADVSIAQRVTPDVFSVSSVGVRPRFLSDRGQVFFTSADPLVAEDVNGVDDVYEFDPATDSVQLLSSGIENQVANFADASASGDDVFIVTRQRLVSSDIDDLIDLYDVRHGSALDTATPSAPTPCDGDGCQAPSPPVPDEPSMGTLEARGQDLSVPARRRLVLRAARRARVRGGAGSLRVRVPAAGILSWSGRGLKGGSRRLRGRQVLWVPLRLSRAPSARLRRADSYRSTIRFTLVSRDGRQAKHATRVTFRATKKGSK